MRTLKCRTLASWCALCSWRPTASARYLSTSASLGRTAISVKLSLQVGQKGRNRFTFGIAITLDILADPSCAGITEQQADFQSAAGCQPAPQGQFGALVPV